MKMPLRGEPAVRHGLIIGVLAALLGLVGIELSATDRAALDGLILAAIVALPVIQGLVQAVWTRSKVTSDATLEAAGTSRREVEIRAEAARLTEWDEP
jgi:hypothetical protein